MIHLFGDSHTTAIELVGDDKIVLHHIGAVLAYSFGREKLNRLNIANGYNIIN